MKTLKITNSTIQYQKQAFEFIQNRAKEDNLKKSYNPAHWDTIYKDALNNDVYTSNYLDSENSHVEIIVISSYKKDQAHKKDVIKFILND